MLTSIAMVKCVSAYVTTVGRCLHAKSTSFRRAVVDCCTRNCIYRRKMVLTTLVMTTFVGSAALHFAPTGMARPVVLLRRAAILVMDEEVERYSMPFTNVTAAAADIKEVLTKEGFSEMEETTRSPEDVAKAAWLEKTYGAPTGQAASPAAEVSPQPTLSAELVALTEEKDALDKALLQGYDAEKVKRLAEVEAILAKADLPAPAASALSPEEEAKAKWLAARARPSWGNTD